MQENVYATLGFTHHKAPITLREKLAFSTQEENEGFLSALLNEYRDLIAEVLLVSTCNRTEFFFTTPKPQEAFECILQALAQTKRLELGLLRDSMLGYSGNEAIHHIFCVASSLDSAIIGETQIAGQLKDGYRLAHSAKLCAKDMTRIMHFAFKTAAKVRNQTQISSNAISVASVAVQKAGALQQEYHLAKKALVIGFGEMGQLALKHLLSDGFEACVLLRDVGKAGEFLSRQSQIDLARLRVESLERLPDCLREFHLIISATSAFKPIITDESLSALEDSRARFYFDLALPRDVEISPSLMQELNIHVFCVDDLKQISQNNLLQRQESLKKAHQIVGVATMEFVQWLQSLGVEPLIKSIREMAKNASLRELDRAIKKGYIPRELQSNVEKLLHQAFNRFLHKPTQILRQQSSRQEFDIIIESVKTFFDIDESLLINAYQCEYEKKEK